MSSNVYLFVISSLNHSIYREIQMKRRHLLRHYKIPYTVLINEEESPLDDKKAPTLVPLNDDEIMYNGAGYNPYMAQKFLTTVKLLFRSYENYEDIPNYIVRINATVYVHYPSLLKVLNDDKFPKERVLAGPNWSNTFVQGMIMVFSKDVLANMLRDPRMYSKEIMKDNDDVSLSVLADPYSTWIDWNEHSCWYFRICAVDDKERYLLDRIKPEKNNIWIFRVCNHESNRKTDIVNWDLLLKYFHEDEIVSKHQNKSTSTTTATTTTIRPDHVANKPPCRWCVGCLLFVFVLFFVATIIKNKKQLYENSKRYVSRLYKKKKKTKT